MARAVPMPWEAVPSAVPMAVSLVIPNILNMYVPKTLPKMPTAITTAAVIAGIPETDLVISMAMGVVTDFAANDLTIRLGDSNQIRLNNTINILETPPMTTAVKNGIILLLISSYLSWNNTPRATTEGPRKKLMYCPPSS